MRRQDHDFPSEIPSAQLTHKLETGNAWHQVIGDHDIERMSSRRDFGQSSFTIAGGSYFAVRAAQNQCEQLRQGSFILYSQNIQDVCDLRGVN